MVLSPTCCCCYSLCLAMSRFARSSGLAAGHRMLLSNHSLPSLLTLGPRVSRSSSVSMLPSSSSRFSLHHLPIRSAVNAPEMSRPSASSPTSSRPSSLQSSRGKSAPAQRVTNPKKTTWITGVAVVPNAREVLLSLYEETLRKVATYNVDEPYNAHLLQLVKYRQAIVQRSTDVEAIEAAIGSGQIEELIEDAEDEFDLLVAMNESIKPWEEDREGDEAFTEYHPSMGQEKKHFDIEPTAEEQKAFDAFEQQSGGDGGAAGSTATPQPAPTAAATAAAKA